jgi:large subunit ribosomal protein L3
MTHMFLFDSRANTATTKQEVFTPVTILDCPPIVPFSIRSYSRTPYGLKSNGQITAENLDKELGRKISPPKKKVVKELTGDEVTVLVHTQPKEISVPKSKPEIFEIAVGGKTFEEKLAYAKGILGKSLGISDLFKTGDIIDVSAVTKGKGVQGPVKRFGVRIQRAKAQRAGKGRHVGTIGNRSAATRWTVPMAGQMGYNTRTEFNKRIIKIGTKDDEITPKGGFVNYGEVRGDFVAIKGSVPGPRKRLIRFRQAIRPRGRAYEPELTYTSLRSQQAR